MTINFFISLGLATLLAGAIGVLLWIPCQTARKTMIGFLIIAATSFAWIYRSQWFAFYSDAPFHLSLIQATAEQGLFPGDPFIEGQATPLHYSLSLSSHSGGQVSS